MGQVLPVKFIEQGAATDRSGVFEGEYTIPSGVTSRLVKAICKLRASRQEFVPPDLLGDPAWDILLHLYAAHVEQRRMSIGGVTAMTGVSGTTILRWLTKLAEADLVTRSADRTDGRRVFVSLSPNGILAMNRYFAHTGAWTTFV